MIPNGFAFYNYQSSQNPYYWPSSIIICPVPWQYDQFPKNQSENSIHFYPNYPSNPVQISHSPSLPIQQLRVDITHNDPSADRSSQNAPPESKQEIPKEIRKNAEKRKKKIYERDADRNIIPNIVNKLYSFIGCKSRNQQIVDKFLNAHPDLKRFCSANKFFVFHKQLRCSLNKFLLQEDLLNLFVVHQHFLETYSEQEQNTIIRINIFMLNIYYKRMMPLLGISNSSRIGKDKLEKYLEYFRKVKDNIDGLCVQWKSEKNK